MSPEQKAVEAQILQMNAVEYWYRVDHEGGKGVSEMFCEDGVFQAGPGKPLIGRKAIDGFYDWREDRGRRTSRHLIVNFHARFESETRAVTTCVMQLLAADGEPIHEASVPIFTGDQIDHCVKGEDGIWRYARRDFTPLFMGGVAPTVPPQSIADEHNLQGEKA